MTTHAPIRFALTLILSLAAVFEARAQDFPNRPITVMVGLSPGGITDVTTRQFAGHVSKNIGQTIVIENRPAAAGAIAASSVQNAKPDGYTLLSVVGAQFASVPAMNAAGYHPVKGFAPITLLFRLPTLLVVPYNSPVKSVQELLALGKTKPDGLLMGSPGAGSPGHLLGALISMGTKVPMQSVHYRGGAPLMADLISERLDFTLASYNSARSYMEAKKLRALAVDADVRLPALPDVPTMGEVGLGQYKVGDWCGLLAPAGTPEAIVTRLNQEFVKAAKNPELVQQLVDNGNLIATSTPDEMRKIVTDEWTKMERLIATLGLKTK